MANFVIFIAKASLWFFVLSKELTNLIIYSFWWASLSWTLTWRELSVSIILMIFCRFFYNIWFGSVWYRIQQNINKRKCKCLQVQCKLKRFPVYSMESLLARLPTHFSQNVVRQIATCICLIASGATFWKTILGHHINRDERNRKTSYILTSSK